MPTFLGHFELPRAVAADARLLLVVGERARGDSAITIFDHQANKPKATHALPGAARAACALGDGRFVVGADDGRMLLVGDAVEVLATAKAAVLAVAAHGPKEKDTVVAVDAAGHLHTVTLSNKDCATRALSERRLRAVAINDTHIAAGGDDGQVIVVARQGNAEPRRMSGHDGGVSALCFVRDGRVASAGDDGTVQLWYLTGAADAEVRGKDQSGHDGGVTGMTFVASGDKDGATEDRLYTCGKDGAVKSWRLEDKKKPRTDALGGAVVALCVVEAKGKPGHGTLFVAGQSRRVFRRALQGPNAWSSGDTLEDGYAKAKDALTGAKARREETIAALGALDDEPALELLVAALAGDKEADVRAGVAKGLGARDPASAPARRTKEALRQALGDADAGVRAAAWDALTALERDDALAVPRAALSSAVAHTRLRALRQLSIYQNNAHAAVARGLVMKKLVDGDAAVAATALSSLVALSSSPKDALRQGLLRGTPTVRFDALLRAALLRVHDDADVSDLFSRAFDDDATVRDRAFGLAVVLRLALHGLRADQGFEGRLLELGRRLVELRRLDEAMATPAAPPPEKTPPPPSDADAKAALAALPVKGTTTRGPDDDRPLLLALASQRPDTALRGAWGFASFGDVRALGALLQLSRHDDAAVRRQAAALLRAYDASDAKTRLVWLLDDKDAGVRSAAFDAFAAGVNDAHVVADTALRSGHEDVRARALNLVTQKAGSTASDDPAVASLIDDALDDEAAAVRQEAEKAAHRLAGTAERRQALLGRLIKARFKDTRARAVADLATDTAKKDPPAWAVALVERAVADLDQQVATDAYGALAKALSPTDDDGHPLSDVEPARAHLAAMASAHGSLREQGAFGARRCVATLGTGDELRSALFKQLVDEHAGARRRALETLDVTLPNENGAHVTCLGSSHLELRVRAAELLALRHDDALVTPMMSFVRDKEDLERRLGKDAASALRRRAAASLAALGKPSLVRFFGAELLRDDDPGCREEAARGLALACRTGDEAYLLDAASHADVWVRSWAAEGLARLADARCLPVLAGTLKHEHLPIRRGAVIAFATFGEESYGGLLQGLDDSDLALEHLVFSIVLAHDRRLRRRGQTPTLLSASLSAARPEVRLAAARALEVRANDAAADAALCAVLGPERPEKPGELKAWPAVLRDESSATRLLLALADALAAPSSQTRYAAASALLHRHDPKAFAKAAEAVVALRPAQAAAPADNRPRAVDGPAVGRVRGFLRKVFSQAAATSTDEPSASPALPADEVRRHKQLAFGAYTGIVRQPATGDDAQRVRKDAIDRAVALAMDVHAGIGAAAAVPTVLRALDDGQQPVRKAALAGLKALYPHSASEALTLALMARAEDTAKAALEELAERGELAAVERAVNSPVPEVRKLAFETLEKRASKGSGAHLLLALRGEHDDLRASVLDKLAKRADDPIVTDALVATLTGEHKAVALRAAEILCERGDVRAVDALVELGGSEDDALAARARRALATLAAFDAPKHKKGDADGEDEDDGPKTSKAEPASAAHTAALRAATTALCSLADDPAARDLPGLCRALAACKHDEALAPLIRLLAHEHTAVRAAAFDAGVEVVGKKLRRRDDARAARFFAGAATEKERNDVALLTRAVTELKASGKGSVADDAVTALFVHRDAGVRTAAVAAYAERCRKLKSPTGPLKDVVTKGTRELLLGAAEGLAWVHGAAVGDLCLVPLLLISRASEADDDRERALVALGRLGDARALPELELIADGGAEDAPVSDGMRRAAIEALGRLHNGLSDHDARARVRDRVEAASADDDDDVAYRAVRALRAIGDDWAAHLLVRVLAREPGEQVCREACEAVAALKVTAAEPALADLLGNWDDDIRKPARKALDRLFPGDRARVELLVLDHSEDSDEQQAAAAFLATAGEPGALLERLRDLADDDLKATLRHGLARRPSLPQAAVVALIDSARADVVREGALLLVERDPDRDAAAYGDALGRAFGRLVDKDDVKLTATIVDVLSAQKRQYRPAALAVATARVADPRRCRRPRCAARSSTSSPARAALETGASLDVSASVLADSLSSLSFRLSAAGVAAQQRARLGAHERAALWASS